MNMDLDDVIAAEANDRMAVFWRKQKKVPTGLVFSKAERKLQHKGLHWAPDSFLGYTKLLAGQEDAWYGSNYWSQQLTAIPSPNGLCTQLPGIMLHPKLHEISHRCAPGNDANKVWSVDKNLILRLAEAKWFLLGSAEADMWTNQRRKENRSSQCMVILETVIEGKTTSENIAGAREYGMGNSVSGVLANLSCKGDDGTLVVEGQKHVFLAEMATGYSQFLELAYRISRNMLAERKLQWWLLDDEAEKVGRRQAADHVSGDSAARELSEGWAAFWQDSASKSASVYLGDFIAALGAVGDLLAIEALPMDQMWCID